MSPTSIFRILFIFTILHSRFASAQEKFDVELLADPSKNGPAIADGLKTLEVAEYSDTLRNCIYLKNGFRSAQFINEKEWLSIMDTVIPYRVDIVYSKYPLRDGVYKEIYPLLFNRLKMLFEMDAGLNDASLQWNKVLQTHCVNDAQVNTLFHGIVIWYMTREKLPVADTVVAVEPDENPLVSEQNSLEELKQSVENIKSSSFIPDSLRKILAVQSLDHQIVTLKKFLEKQIQEQPETVLKTATPSEHKRYRYEVDDFIKKFPVRDSVVNSVFNRHPEWRKMLVVNDWTGSMYGYGAQVLQWHLANLDRSGIYSLTLFNDGDEKQQAEKKIGSTEGIYSEKADNVLKLVKLFNYIMLKGSGGDGPENDIEGILRAMENFPDHSEIVLIADNNACVRDIELADRIGKPVRVIICGYSKKVGLNPDFVYLAKKTGGGIYTIEDDLENLDVVLGRSGEVTSMLDKRFDVFARRCGERMFGNPDKIHDYKYARRHKRRVRKLRMDGEELKEIPDAVYKMEHLNYLNLSNNKLSRLSPKIIYLPILKILDLSHNEFSELPGQLKNVYYIETLNLSHNKFTTVPAPVAVLKFMLNLDLSYNQITTLDKRFLTPRLQELNLSNNGLGELSKNIGSLKNLKVLNLSDNELSDLSPKIENLFKLQELNLSNNKFTKLPVQILRLRSLRVLYLNGNSFSEQEKNRIVNSLPGVKVIF